MKGSTRWDVLLASWVMLMFILPASLIFGSCYEVPSDIDVNICVQYDSVDVAGDSIISLCRPPD